MNKHTERSSLRASLIALMLAAAANSAQAFDVSELMSMLAHRSSGEAKFSEQRFVKDFEEPLSATGLLSFAAPDRFTRRTLEPRAETMSVEGNTLTLSRNGRSRTLALDAVPEAVVAVEAVRGALTGNGTALQRVFRINLEGDAPRWVLELSPLDAHAAGTLNLIRITGQRDTLRTVETRLLDGDRTVMTIEPIITGGSAAAAP